MRPYLAPLVLVLLVAACGSGSTPTPGGGAQATAPPDDPATVAPDVTAEAGEATPGTTLTACELVTPADIETALALDPGTVSPGSLESHGTVLDPAVNECRYQDDTWGGLIVNVTPTNGANTYRSLDKVYGDSAERIDAGDGALWFEANDRGYFLKGSVLVLFQFTFLTSGNHFRDPTVELGQAAIAKI
jgi:hypothetical protein